MLSSQDLLKSEKNCGTNQNSMEEIISRRKFRVSDETDMMSNYDKKNHYKTNDDLNFEKKFPNDNEITNEQEKTFEEKLQSYNPQLALNLVGDSGTYQKSLLMVGILTFFSICSILNGADYVFSLPDFYCIDKNEKVYVCKEEEACKSGSIKYTFRSLVSYYGLVCGDQTVLRDYLMALQFFISRFTGCLVLIIADNAGRRFMTNLCLLAITSCLVLKIIMTISLPQNAFHLYFAVITFGICTGLSTAVLYLYYILFTESTGSLRGIRSRAIAFFHVAYGLQSLCIASITRALSSFHYLEIYMCIFAMISTVISYIFLKETPLYYFCRGRPNKFITTLYELSRINQNGFYNPIKFQQLID